MYKDIGVQHTTSDSPYATTSARVINATLVAGCVVVGTLFFAPALWGFSLGVFGTTDTMRETAEWVGLLPFLLLPLACAGAYWLALFRLRRVNALRTWLETLGFSLLYWLVMPILLGVGKYALLILNLLNQYTAFPPESVGGPWVIPVFAGEMPGVILDAVLLALLTSGVALGSAWFFARWDKVREAHLKSRAWLEFLLVLGCVTVATLLTGVAFVYLGFLSFIPVLAAMLAGFAAWTTYRTLVDASLAPPSSTEPPEKNRDLLDGQGVR